jgi:NRPS condensation-like uncharacterized protein
MNCYKAEVWDKVQKNFETFNDHCLHGVIRFDNLLDIEALRKAIWKTSTIFPIIRCRFVYDKKQARWEGIANCTIDNLISIIEVNLSGQKEDELIESTITQRIVETAGPQLSVKLLRNNNTNDTLCIILNHMLCDGGGFKQFLYLLCSQYNLAVTGEKDTKDYTFLQKRSDRQVYSDLTPKDYWKFITKSSFFEKPSPLIRFPFSNNNQQTHPHIFSSTIPPKQFELLIAYTKKLHCTLNDLFIAALFREIDQHIAISHSVPIIISCPVDLRRYIKDKQHIGLCNLVSSFWCSIGLDLGKNLSETTQKVRNKVEIIKRNYPGLKSFYFLNSFLRLLSYAAFEKRMKSFPNPLIGITNTGIIEKKDLTFANASIKSAFMNGSIKFAPYIQIAFSTYENELTISINQYCTDEDASKIEKMLHSYRTQLESALTDLN